MGDTSTATTPRVVPAPRQNGSSAAGETLPVATLIDSASQLESLRASWDHLAVALAAPYSAPAWTLAWWHHAAPARSRLAVVAVHAGRELIGLAPFYASRRLGVTEFRLLAGGWTSRVEILARPGSERDVAAAIVGALEQSEMRPDVFRWEAIDASSEWADWLSGDSVNGNGHRVQEISQRSAPIVSLGEGSFDDWFAAKSSHFRSHMRRNRRRLEKEGATFRRADRASLERDLDSFARLHSSRRKSRGGSTAVGEASMGALLEAGNALIDENRFRLWMIDGPDDDAISAQLYVAAGGRAAFWNTGFDDAWARFSPGAVLLVAAIADCFAAGDTLMDLGGGEASYKERVATEDRPVAWRTSYRRGSRYPLARLGRFPEESLRRRSHSLRARIGTKHFDRLQRMLRR